MIEAMNKRDGSLERSMPLKARVEYAESMISIAVAQGRCGHCAESHWRSYLGLPDHIKLRGERPNVSDILNRALGAFRR